MILFFRSYEQIRKRYDGKLLMENMEGWRSRKVWRLMIKKGFKVKIGRIRLYDDGLTKWKGLGRLLSML